ncbi:MAG: aspartate kinase [Bacteroidota bacterium]
MQVFKFGGASVKDAPSVKNLAAILNRYNDRNLVVVISAMGKTTNALENLVQAYFEGDEGMYAVLDEVLDYHYTIAEVLETGEKGKAAIDSLKEEMLTKLKKPVSLNFNFEYDQVVSFGELLSTTIISLYLNQQGIANKWIDIRNYLKTDNTYREANVDWKLSEGLIRKTFTFDGSQRLYITQGFIGSTINNLTTTLGREGSDFSAAILAYYLWANSVTVWKDVPGVLNADPKFFKETIKLDKISYRDAIELAYYGTSVIHPRTVQPLQNRQIPLYVKSFLNPQEEGTQILNEKIVQNVPCYIFKKDQVLVQISARDFSFIAEEHLQDIFPAFAETGLKINLMQNSAVSFNVCVNNDPTRLSRTIQKLEKIFNVNLRHGLEIITVRYYDDETIASVVDKRSLILTQKTQTTVQMVVSK